MSIRNEMMKTGVEQQLGAKVMDATEAQIPIARVPPSRRNPKLQVVTDEQEYPVSITAPVTTTPVPTPPQSNVDIGTFVNMVPCELLPPAAKKICEAIKGFVPGQRPNTPVPTIPSGPPLPQVPIPLQMGACPSGYHLNKSSYFLKSGEFVPARSRCVRNRRRNPLNPRALNRATGRLLAYDKTKKRVEKAIKKATPRPAPRRRRTPSKPCGCGEGATIVKA